MRQAFEDSYQGHEVVVERYNQKFQLVSLVDKPLVGHSFESVPKQAPKIIKTAKEVPVAIASDYKQCKHGADPSMCKHAKPGKPCK